MSVLESGTGYENLVVEGAPAEVAVVDGSERVQFPWAPMASGDFAATHPDGCHPGTSPGLTIHYGFEGRPEITPMYYCETARPDSESVPESNSARSGL